MAYKYLDETGLAYFWGKLKGYFQEKLVSGTNIKTVHGTSILGSGNINTPQPIFVNTWTANKTCNGGSDATLTAGAPSVPSGYKNLGIVNIWVDSTNTTDSANTSYVVATNYWDDTTSAPKVKVRNFGTTLAKFTLHARYLLVPDS